jgi:hypothetical protein
MIAWLKKKLLFKQRPAHKGVAAMSQNELKDFIASRQALGRTEVEIAKELDIPVTTLRVLRLVKYE